MHVLDLLIGKKHGHKVSFESVPDQGPDMQQNEQAAGSSGKAEDTQTAQHTAAAAANSTSSGSSVQHPSQYPQAQQRPQNQVVQQQLVHAHTHPPHLQQQDGGDPHKSHKSKLELRKLMRRAAVSFRDLNISVHEASTNSLAQLHDTAGATGAAPHTHTGASVLTAGRQRVEVEQKKLAIIMVSFQGYCSCAQYCIAAAQRCCGCRTVNALGFQLGCLGHGRVLQVRLRQGKIIASALPLRRCRLHFQR